MTMGVMSLAKWVVGLLFVRGAPLLGGFFLMLMSLQHILSPATALLADFGAPTLLSTIGGVILVPIWLGLLARGIYGG